MMQTSKYALSGKIILVTGATAGIGKETARGLAHMGATVVVAGRSPDKTRAVVDELKRDTDNPNIDMLLGDLFLLSDVRRLAAAFLANYSRLDVLINNAGAAFARRELTPEGFEKTWALNYLSGYLLTHLLLDVLKVSAPARIINVTSLAHRQGKIDFGNLQGERRYRGYPAYAASKLAQILFTREMARRLDGTNVTVNAVHPGFVPATFTRGSGLGDRLFLALSRPFAKTIPQGAETSIYLASSSEVEGLSGCYFANCRVVTPAKAAQDMKVAGRLWDISAQQAGM
jgi:NAD(P)-dependent dehydrogenase (short-subunit alcohol dehydrogenase family)